MEKIKAVIVDDEPDSLRTLQLLIKKYCPQVEVPEVFTNPKAALKEIPKLNPQLLFLDIQMPGMTGFDLLGKLKDFSGSVIFVTAHADYAVRAIKFSALDYLLKPVDIAELKDAVAKFMRLHTPVPGSDLLRQLTSNIDFMSQPVYRKISVSTQQGIEIVLLEDIHYLKADSNYTLIHCRDKKPLMVAKPLKDFVEALPASQFMRVHTSYVVNLHQVQRYVRAEGGYAVMPDGKEITVSRSHKDAFLEYLKL